jgi:hypothetical protein
MSWTSFKELICRLAQINRRSKTIAIRLAIGLVALVTLSVPAAAQLGNELCDTPLVTLANGLAPPIITGAVMGGLFMAVVMNAVAGMIGDPEQARYYKRWRNRALIAAISTPVLAYFLGYILAQLNAGLAECIHLFPFGFGP